MSLESRLPTNPRIGFVTCVKLGLECLEALARRGPKIDLVISLNDDKAPNKSGRVYLDEFCNRSELPLVKVDNINDENALKKIQRHELDWVFVIGWSQILGSSALNLASQGSIGAHPTLLPQGRGNAAVPWAILKGLDKTGVSFFRMDHGVDTGPILHQEVIPIDPNETANTLYRKITDAHVEGICELVPRLLDGSLEERHQDAKQATVWPKRRPSDGRIDQTMTVAEVERLVRAVTHPYPGAFWDSKGERVRIWSGEIVDCNDLQQGRRIKLVDGCYDALEFEIEPIFDSHTS